MLIELVDEYSEAGHLVYAAGLPGAYARGRTQAQALAKLPAELSRYCAWAGLAVDGPPRTRVVQEKRSALHVEDADSDVLFDSELAPLTAGGVRFAQGAVPEIRRRFSAAV